MDLLTSLAVGLGLFKTICHILPVYYTANSSGVLPALFAAYSDWDRTQDAFRTDGGWSNGFHEYDFIVGMLFWKI